MNFPSNQAVQGSQNIWTIIVSVVITALIVGGGLMFYQRTQIDALNQKVKVLEIQNESIVSQNKKISQDLVEAKELLVLQELPTSSLCTVPATVTDIGSEVFPIDQKYNNLKFLGQLFTAFKCGSERVSKIFGIKESDYTLGSHVWLKNIPSASLTNTFKSIGYKCVDPETNCKEWELITTVKVNDLMKLEPFYENFEADDCINCG